MLDPLSDFTVSLPPPAPSRPVWPTRKLLQPVEGELDSYTLELDYSSLSKFLECPRSGENYLVRSREAARDHSATDFGKLFHECEEQRLHIGFTDALRQWQREHVLEHFVTHPTAPGDHRTAPRMLEVLAQYEQRYLHDGWEKKVVMHEGEPFIERPFKIELCTLAVNADIPYPREQLVVGNWEGIPQSILPVRSLHILFTGRIDAALHDSNLIFVVDNKTSSMGGSDFENAFRLSLQTRGYVWALQKILGLPVAGLIMNALVIKPPTRKLQNNTELTRHTYHYPQDSLKEWEANVRASISDFVHCLTRGYFPQYARSFKSPCAMCDYSENCTLPRDQRDRDLTSQSYRDVTWSPIH